MIAASTRIWLLDEPANGLDRDAVPLLERAIANHREAGGAVIIASHIDIALLDARIIDLQSVPA